MSQSEKPVDKNDHVVIALFGDEQAAQAAIDGIKVWDKANDQMKLGAIGLLRKEGDKVKTSVGRKTGRGVAIGATVGIIGAVLTGGASLIAGAVGAGTLGGAVGAFLKNSMGLTKEEIAQIGQELDAGRVAVVVPCDEYEIPLVTEFMSGPGVTVRAYDVSSDALIEVAKSPEVMDAVTEE